MSNSGYIGTQPIPRASQTSIKGTTTSDITVLVVPGGYTAGNIEVYLNGIFQQNNYIAENGVDITFDNIVTSGTNYFVKEIVSYSIASATNVTTANGSNVQDELNRSSGSLTLAEGMSDITLTAGTRVRYRDYADGNGAGDIVGEWVSTGTITPDLGNPAHNTLSLVFKQNLVNSVNVKQFGAVGDGVTDDTAAIQAADSAGDFSFTDGTYKASSSITISSTVSFDQGSIIKPDTNVTVTFSGGIVGEGRLFDLSASGSAIAGLNSVILDWFTGHLLNTTTDAYTLIQKAYDSCITSAPVYWPSGYLTISGATAVSVTKGQQTIGVGSFSSKLVYNTATCNGFSVSSTIGASFRDMQISVPNNTIKPTSGTSVSVAASYCTFDNFIISGGFTGISYSAGAGKASKFDVLDCWNIGVYVLNTNDVYFDQFTIVAALDRLNLSGVTGTFQVGEVITGGTSGATAEVEEIVSSTVIRCKVFDINFTASEGVTGGTSSATATMDSQDVPHALGGIRLVNKAEAIIFTDGDVIGGQYAMTTAASSYSLGVRPAYNSFTGVYFDSSDNGVVLDKNVATRFENCWFSNRPSNGLTITADNEDLSFINCHFINSWRNGCFVNAGIVGLRFNGCTFSGNNKEGSTYDGLQFAANVTDFVVQGCKAGGTLGFGTQRFGVHVNAGTSDRYIIADNLIEGNITAGVQDGGTGSNKRVADNY